MVISNRGRKVIVVIIFKMESKIKWENKMSSAKRKKKSDDHPRCKTCDAEYGGHEPRNCQIYRTQGACRFIEEE